MEKNLVLRRVVTLEGWLLRLYVLTNKKEAVCREINSKNYRHNIELHAYLLLSEPLNSFSVAQHFSIDLLTTVNLELNSSFDEHSITRKVKSKID